MKSLFEYQNYKTFLVDRFPKSGQKIFSRRNLANFIKCAPGFVSQVLNGDAHFSQEQMIAVAELLELNEEETDFLLNLRNLYCSGTSRLRMHYQNKISKTLKSRSEIKGQLTDGQEVPQKVLTQYYRNWKVTAVHMALRNRALSTPEKVSTYLQISLKETHECIELLNQAGLVEIKPNKIKVTKRRVHISEKSINLEKHHLNWRLEAIRQIQNVTARGQHFTSIISLSESAHQKINQLILNLIKESEPIIRDAAAEQVSVLGIDFYKLGK